MQTEIAGHEPRIRAVCDNGVQMIDNGRSLLVVFWTNFGKLC